MILLKEKRLVRGKKNEPITAWVVWFNTPFGLVEKLEEAEEVAKIVGAEMQMITRPVCVALGETFYEVMT